MILAELALLKYSNDYAENNSGLNEDSNPDLCDSGAVLHQLSHQANWELIVMWVDFKPEDDRYRSYI